MINIKCCEKNQTVQFAAQELAYYLKQMCNEDVTVINENEQILNEEYLIEIGTYKHLIIKESSDSMNRFDDDIFIDICCGKGLISGCNPRSVLFSAYRFLKELGCRWIIPGKSGDWIPQNVFIGKCSVRVKERPSYRHRGICIEGANSNQNILDIIDWMPKSGLNSYFIQFRNSYTFYDKWYSHVDNPYLKPEKKSIKDIDGYVQQAIKEIKKRDIIYHAVGHGWTCEPFGIKGLGWDENEGSIDEKTKEHFALVDGKRELFHNVALDTNLCYSNPDTRGIVINDMVKYIEEHQEIDVLHFWLADGWNNHCECTECSKMLPSDYYVLLLQELDQKLEQKKLDIKIVFLIYVDLLWSPEKMEIINQDRFILMFAPISRTYTTSFSLRGQIPKMSEYKRNKLIFPRTVEQNISALRGWQEKFKGDSFDFDYHLIWDHYFDPGYMKCARILYEDLKELKNIGLNGFISCQVQRAFFPNGLCMYILGEVLWNREIDYSEMINDYFVKVYGDDGELCMKYLEKISELFDPAYLRGEKGVISQENWEKLEKVPETIYNFLPTIKNNMEDRSNSRAYAWKMLKIHAEIILVFTEFLSAYAEGNKEKAELLKEKFYNIVAKNEEELQTVLDGHMFIDTIRKKLFLSRI